MCCVIPPASPSATLALRAVEQQRLAVVDMAHDRDDRRTDRRIVSDLIGKIEQLLEFDLLLLTRIDQTNLRTHLSGEQLDHVVAQRLGQ